VSHTSKVKSEVAGKALPWVHIMISNVKSSSYDFQEICSKLPG